MFHEGKALSRTKGDRRGGMSWICFIYSAAGLAFDSSFVVSQCWHGFGVQLSVLTSHVELRMKNVCLYYLSLNTVNIIHPKTVNKCVVDWPCEA